MANTFTLIETKTLTTTTAGVTFTLIPGTYTDLLLKISARSDYSSDGWQQIYINFNGDYNTSNYSNRALFGYNNSVDKGTNTTFGSINLIWGANGDGATANTFGNTSVYITNYASTSYSKTTSSEFATETNSTNSALQGMATGVWANNAAITSIDIVCTGGPASFKTYSTFTLYGISNS